MNGKMIAAKIEDRYKAIKFMSEQIEITGNCF